MSVEASNQYGEGNRASTVPDSLTNLSKNCLFALREAIKAGYKRLLIDVDLAQGDPTYTTLKNAVPFVRELLKLMEHKKELTTTTVGSFMCSCLFLFTYFKP